MSVIESRDCPNCGTPVTKAPGKWQLIKLLFNPSITIEPGGESHPGGGWMESLPAAADGVRVWVEHSKARCDYFAARSPS